MDKNIDKKIDNDNYTEDEFYWICKICRDVPFYAELYLSVRQNKQDEKQIEDNDYIDIQHLKYYYALLHILDEIHQLPMCPNPECSLQESKDKKCSSPEYFDYYRNIYNTYANILILEKEITKINLKCAICSILPYTIFVDLDMIAKGINIEYIEKLQKLELEAVITDYYMNKFGCCEHWDKCKTGVDWLEMMNSDKILKEYLTTKDRKELNINLSNWNWLRANDKILNIGIKTTQNHFKAQDIPAYMLENKTLVYLDFGVYQLYESNEIFHSYIDSFSKTNKIHFVYSPTHMEEVCRMNNSEFENNRIYNISKICDDYEVLSVGDGKLKIMKESAHICFARAQNLKDLNESAEQTQCAKFESLDDNIYELLKWDKNEMKKIGKTISKLTSTQLFDTENDVIDNNILNKIFSVIAGSQYTLESFKDYGKEERTFADVREAIYRLYMLMNALGYHRNKIEKRTKFTDEALYPNYDRKFYRTIRSGFYDVDHMSYATKCDYFVTCDYALSLQAIEIYRYLGFKTKVIYCKKQAYDPSLPLVDLLK